MSDPPPATPLPPATPPANTIPAVTIYVDGDACPVREEVYRVAARLGVSVVVVSNGSRPIRPPNLPFVRMVVVGEGADIADDWIAERITPADVCVTADIPLAARCLARATRALSSTGHVWSGDNIGTALAGREVSRHMRETGLATGGPRPLDKAARSAFLNALDTAVQAAKRSAKASKVEALPQTPPKARLWKP